jgi:tetratricopeptide (TPR) repeat protein
MTQQFQRLLAHTVLAAALAGVGATRLDAQTPSRMLVMPFETGDDARSWWLGEGAAVLLADDLRALGIEAIGRDERLRAFGRLQVPPVASLGHSTVIRIGQLVGASAVVVGTIKTTDDRLVIRARTLRLDTGRLQGEVEEQGSLDGLFTLFDRIAHRLVSTPSWPPSREQPAMPTPAAFESYVKGLLADIPAAQAAFLEKAIALHPAYDAARLALWRAYTDAGEPDRALAAAKAVAASSAFSRAARFAAALSELALDQYDAAFSHFRELWDETHAGEAANNLGVLQLRRGGTSEAGSATYWFTRAKEASSEPDYFFNLGYAYWFEQDVQAAIYWLREVVRRDPTDGDAHFVLGSALQVSGSTVEGGRELELAERLAARHTGEDRRPGERVPRGLERVRESMGTPAVTSAEVTLAATEQRERSELAAFHLARGRRAYDAEDDRQAIEELRRALYLSPYLAEAHLLLGRTYLRGGRPRDAVESLKIAVWSEETAAAHEVLAEAYVQLKDVAAARREAERALAMDPRSESVQQLLARLPAK